MSLTILTLSLLLVRFVWGYNVTEINFGQDKIISFSVKNIKMKIGFSLFVGAMSFRIAEDENGKISEKQHRAMLSIEVIVNVLLLAMALVINKQNIVSLLKYFSYCFFLIDIHRLRALLHHFSILDVIVGLCEISLAWSLLNRLLISLSIKDKFKDMVLLIAGVALIICSAHLLYDYLFWRELKPVISVG